MKRVLHLTTHLNIGGITSYIKLLTQEMKKMDYKFYIGSSGGTQEKTFLSNDVQCLTLNIKTKSEISPKVYLAIRPLSEYIRREKIDLIHAHTRITQVLAWWIQRFVKIPVVTTCHGFYKPRFGRRALPAWGNRAIAISAPVSDALIQNFGVKPQKVTTIYNAVNVTDLENRYWQKNPSEIREHYHIPKECPVVGIVARVVSDKGHDYFLRAVAELVKNDYPKLKALIVGEGPYLPNMRSLAIKLGIEKSVFFLGNLEDVTEALSIIDIFILPAIWREGFGLSIVEAMAVNKPVIVTNIWALNELVQNRVNGLLVKPKDTDGLANAISELLKDRTLFESLAKNGRAMVNREFSIHKMAARMDELYRQVLAEFQNN